jgi:ribosomal protein S18 acetylase RimI-like enzyme
MNPPLHTIKYIYVWRRGSLIRKRIPSRDDKAILCLVQALLVPFARNSQPDLRVDLKTIKTRLKDCDNFVAMGAGRQPCGFISIRPGNEGMFIDMLAVNPRLQGKGIGSQLLFHAERAALKAGKREIFLYVDDSNVQAQRFYASKYYEPIHYDSHIRCYMLRKQLG